MHCLRQWCNLLVLQDDDRVGVADGSLEQTLGILCAVWRDDLESGNASVPRSVILRVLGSDTGGETIGATEGDVAGLDTTGHVVCLCGRVDNLVNGLHGKVERHELALALPSELLFAEKEYEGTDNRVQASERSTDGQTSETRLGNGRVDDPLLTKAVEQALGDLVTAGSVSVMSRLATLRIVRSEMLAIEAPAE